MHKTFQDMSRVGYCYDFAFRDISVKPAATIPDRRLLIKKKIRCLSSCKRAVKALSSITLDSFFFLSRFSVLFLQYSLICHAATGIVREPIRTFKSDGQEKSTKILISWQELKNKFLSFLAHRQLLGR